MAHTGYGELQRSAISSAPDESTTCALTPRQPLKAIPLRLVLLGEQLGDGGQVHVCRALNSKKKRTPSQWEGKKQQLEERGNQGEEVSNASGGQERLGKRQNTLPHVLLSR